MATSKQIYQHLVDVMPGVVIPGHIYYVTNKINTSLKHYVVDNNGVLRFVGDLSTQHFQKENDSLIGIQNQINTQFTTQTSFVLKSTKIYLNGQRLLEGGNNDYTEVLPNIITFNFAPHRTDQIIIDYKY